MQSVGKKSGSTSTVGTVQGADTGRLLSGGMGQKDNALTFQGMWIKPISRQEGCQDWIRIDAIIDVRYERIVPKPEMPVFYAVKVRVAERSIPRTVLECDTPEEAESAAVTLMREIDGRRELGCLA